MPTPNKSQRTALQDDANRLLRAFYSHMLRLKTNRADSAQLDMLRRARAALETRGYQDAVRQLQSFQRAARSSVGSSDKAAKMFSQAEQALRRLKLCVDEEGV